MAVKRKNLSEWSDDALIRKYEELKDLLTPNGERWEELRALLEIEREFTLREDR